MLIYHLPRDFEAKVFTNRRVTFFRAGNALPQTVNPRYLKQIQAAGDFDSDTDEDSDHGGDDNNNSDSETETDVKMVVIEASRKSQSSSVAHWRSCGRHEYLEGINANGSGRAAPYQGGD